MKLNFISVLILSAVASCSSSKGNVCVVRPLNGKLVKDGNCESPSMNTEVPELDAKLKARDKPTQETTTSKPFSAETSTRKYECIFNVNGSCYWVYIDKADVTRFKQAHEICTTNGSIVAYFPTAEVYNRAVAFLRSLISSGEHYITVWTGVTFNVTAGKVDYPVPTYTKWRSNYPSTTGPYHQRSHVYLVVRAISASTDQGMENRNPALRTEGVICMTLAL